jgi:Asp-tRNA(Asn)/Glu-tRNA(Gln) amidotransferase A subunit family amidase
MRRRSGADGRHAGREVSAIAYDPRTARYLDFAAARRGFAAGTDTPRAYLEHCLDVIASREPEIRAFVCLQLDAARAAADASTRRWRAGRPLSAVDGLPAGIKDCFDVRGLPTRVNSELFGGEPVALDAAHVDALRRGGAAIVGKTVTTELTMAGPGPTWNPWDLRRTPGGSSSGSAAAVAARMLPIATGSQVRGSVLRPASICGLVAMKPSFGALNRLGGFDPSPSLNHLGLLGGTLTDIWETAHHIAAVVGGDPGMAPLAGGAKLPAASMPRRLARQYTPGWKHTDETSKAAFEEFLRKLGQAQVEIVEPGASEELAAYEDATARTPEFFFDVMLWEMRWPMIAWRDAKPEALSETVRGYLAKAEKMTVEDYRRASRAREILRARHRALAGKIDGFITLAHIGPGQLGQPAVGTPWYNDPSSAIGAPTFNLPLLAAEDVPLGVQIMGFEGEDERLAAQARALLAAFESPTVGPG